MSAKSIVCELLNGSGVSVDGNNPWDIKVSDDEFYQRVLSKGSLGLGESYISGQWNSERIDMFVDKVLSGGLEKKISKGGVLFGMIKSKLFNRQRKSKAFDIGEKHYDLGNDLYREMLDKRMVYTCGYWRDSSNLDDAQEAKLDLSCRKLGLERGMRVLDIGCGWGSFAKYAAEKYGVNVVGVSVSKEQIKLGKKMSAKLPVDLRLQDYRDVHGKFDRIVSLGMFEHVGPKNYKVFMKKVSDSLEDDGLFLLHTIGRNVSSNGIDKYIDKYIFPGGVLPSVKQIAGASENELVLRDWHEFGQDYDKTLMAWNHNFQSGWSGISWKYGKEFKRMWEYYLLSCAGSFRSGQIQLWQIIFSKEGKQKGYKSIR